jgi:HD-like signal output (HDOD) protein
VIQFKKSTRHAVYRTQLVERPMMSVTSECPGLEEKPAETLLSSEDGDILSALFENWERFLEVGMMLRPISPLAVQLLNLDQDSYTPREDLARIIESDPVLSARILGLANSVAFAGTAKPVYKLGEAITRLGVDSALTAAFSHLTAQWLRGAREFIDPPLLRGLWFEYLVTAHGARELAIHLPHGGIDCAPAYAAGLLHDLGTIALTWLQPAPMSRFLRSQYGNGGSLYPAFVKAHTQLGAGLLRRWRVPAEIATVAACHHVQPAFSETLSITVLLADQLHPAVLADDRANFTQPPAYQPGCYDESSGRVASAVAALAISADLDAAVGRIAQECRVIEALAAVLNS